MITPYQVLLDGTAYINVGTNAALDTSAAFTVTAWVNITTLTNLARIFQYTNNTQVYTLAANASGAGVNANAIWGSNGSVAGASPINSITAGTWLHVATTLTSGTIALYINGASQTVTSVSTVAGADTQGTVGGRLNGGVNDRGFVGGIADLAIYNRGLSAAEISQNCKALSIQIFRGQHAIKGLVAGAKRHLGGNLPSRWYPMKQGVRLEDLQSKKAHNGSAVKLLILA